MTRPLTPLEVQILQSTPGGDEITGSVRYVFGRLLVLPLPPGERRARARMVDEAPAWVSRVLCSLERRGCVRRRGWSAWLTWWRRTSRGDRVLRQRGLPTSWKM